MSSHIRITGERWIQGSPGYGIVVYEIPEWRMRATRRTVQEQMTVTFRQDKWHNCEVSFSEWYIEMPDLILEIRNPLKLKQPQNLAGNWDMWMYLGQKYGISISDYAHLVYAYAVGDVDQFKEMITYYKIMFDWGNANGARL